MRKIENFEEQPFCIHSYVRKFRPTCVGVFFHRMIGLRFNGASISLEGKSSTQLGLELLGRRYATETIRYADLEADLTSRPQVMAEECARMAKVLYLLGAYFFANWG